MKKHLLLALLVTGASQTLMAGPRSSSTTTTVDMSGQIETAKAQMMQAINNKKKGIGSANMTAVISPAILDRIMSAVTKIAAKYPKSVKIQAMAENIRVTADEAIAGHYTRQQTKAAMLKALDR